MRLNNYKEQLLVRSYVKEVLKEYYDGSSYGYDTGGYGPAGRYLNAGSFYKAFIQPWTAAASAIAGHTKELTTKFVTFLKVVFEGVVETLLPFLEAEYDKIFLKEKSNLAKIAAQHKEAYSVVDAAFNSDVIALAVLSHPAAFLIGSMALKAPRAAQNITDAMTGNLFSRMIDTGSDAMSSKTPADIFSSQEAFESYSRVHSFLIQEKSSKKPNSADVDRSRRFIGAIKKSLRNSEQAQEITKSARQVHISTLKNIREKVLKDLSIQSLEDLESIIGSTEEIKKLKGIQDPEEKKAAIDQLIKGVRESQKKMHIDRLKKHIKPVVDQFGENNPFVQDYLELIKKIEAF